VYSAALGSAFWMTVVALLVRAYAEQNAPQALGTDPKLLASLLSFPAQVPPLSLVCCGCCCCFLYTVGCCCCCCSSAVPLALLL
jgi:hypothetical protein